MSIKPHSQSFFLLPKQALHPSAIQHQVFEKMLIVISDFIYLLFCCLKSIPLLKFVPTPLLWVPAIFFSPINIYKNLFRPHLTEDICSLKRSSKFNGILKEAARVNVNLTNIGLNISRNAVRSLMLKDNLVPECSTAGRQNMSVLVERGNGKRQRG